jgi:hypothetical protein
MKKRQAALWHIYCPMQVSNRPDGSQVSRDVAGDSQRWQLDEVRSNPAVLHVALLENAPADISGQAGFKLVYTYLNRDGPRVHYGLRQEDWLYRILYQAPVQYYFEHDIDTFECIRASLRLSSKT